MKAINIVDKHQTAQNQRYSQARRNSPPPRVALSEAAGGRPHLNPCVLPAPKHKSSETEKRAQRERERERHNSSQRRWSTASMFIKAFAF